MKCTRESLLLYAVTDCSWLGEQTLAQQVEAVLRGGVTFVQLREKELHGLSLLQEATQIQALCRQYQVPFVIDDDVEAALQVQADGVHIGQHDMDAFQARRLLGPDRILGVSVQTAAQAVQAQQSGADYLGVGAVFPTGTKKDADAVSFETLREICSAVSIPVIAIGGITAENVSLLNGSGIAGIAVISALFAQADLKAAAETLYRETSRIVRKERQKTDENSLDNCRQ